MRLKAKTLKTLFSITLIYVRQYATHQVSLILMEIQNKYQWTIIFLPLVIGFFSFRKFQQGTKYIFYFVAFGSVTEIMTRSLNRWLDLIDNTMPIGHIYIPVSFLLAGLFYFFRLRGFISEKIVAAIIILFIIFSIINSLLIQNIYSFANYSGAIGALILIGFSVLLFAKIMVEGKIKKLIDEPIVWINSSILVYYTANFFFYILYNILLENSIEFLKQTIFVFNIFNVIFYILISIGFWKTK